MIREGLTFDDVLLVPQYSDIGSRSRDVDISISVCGRNFKHPVIAANMQTITGEEMALAIIKLGGLAILHRFMPIEEQLKIVKNLTEDAKNTHHDVANHLAVSVGVKPNDRENIFRFYDAGVRTFCIDIAHGDSEHCLDMIKWIKGTHPGALVIAGNIATGEGARRLWSAGADIVKVGVGPGSLCTTRVETGNGVPQLTAIMDVAEAQRQLRELERTKQGQREFPFIADGGIKEAGDVVKALCYADMVMLGNVFAGCQETPGATRTINGISYKEYVGSSTHKTNHVEGVSALVPCKGSYESILTRVLEGLRSGCSYQGVRNLADLKDNPAFIRITNAGLKESHPHDVILNKG